MKTTKFTVLILAMLFSSVSFSFSQCEEDRKITTLNDTYMSVERDDFRIMNRAISEKDVTKLNELVKSRKVFTVEKCSEFCILNHDFHLYSYATKQTGDQYFNYISIYDTDKKPNN